jgi:hypothetical protein
VNDAPSSMTPRDGVVASGWAALVGLGLIPVLLAIGSLIYATVSGDSRESVAILFTFLIAASGFLTFAALLTLVAELFAWRDVVRLAEEDRARRVAAQPELHHHTTTSLSTFAQPTAEEVASELLRNALAKRDEALREAERIARVLHLIDKEISK